VTCDRVLWVLLLVVALVTTAGCAKPVQSGGLGVFNPAGFEGRMALAGAYSANRSSQNNEAVPTKSPK
jgi:hypothetical protein